ncbi:MAG: class I SAM-dependent methyltransferase [Anaerolineae bacterium]|nr:class I SAM-dependent methyltransferase [Anaerolineae bacterium]
MKSQFAEAFNHDEDAPAYDNDVLDETHPIRAGYDAVLNWVSEKSAHTCGAILDLGAGTGNLSRRLKNFKRLVCVDVSDNMLNIARRKLAGLNNVEYVKTDLLAYFFNDPPLFDAIVSTYAIHHLTEAEKPILFEKIYAALPPGGRAVFGDLMFADAAAQAQLAQKFQNEGRPDVVADFADEFFWFVDQANASLTGLGFETEIKRFSDLSWGIAARKL